MSSRIYPLVLALLIAGPIACGEDDDAAPESARATSHDTGAGSDAGNDAVADGELDMDTSASEEDIIEDEGDVAPLSLDGLLETCVDLREVSSGTLCAVQPSQLDPETKDIFGVENTVPERTIGYGYHAIGVPDDLDASKGLWVHIGGTYGRPFDPDKDDYPSELWLSELMAQGYVVVQVAYDNRRSVNDDCKAPNPGAERDNCAGEIREEVLTGLDVSPFRETDLANGFDYRLSTLLSHVAGLTENLLPADLDPEAPAWGQLRVSGHSQGGNMAYYLARRRGVVFACMLGSPYDVADEVNPSRPPIADWFTEGTSLTPVEALGQLITSEDMHAGAFRGASSLLGLTPGEEFFEVSEPPYVNAAGEEINGHAAALAAPALASYRAQACLR